MHLFSKLLCATSKCVLYVFRNVFFANKKKLLNCDLTCRDLKEKSGGGGGRHSKEGPDGEKLAQVKTSSSSVLQSSN